MEEVLHSRGVQGLSKIIGIDQSGSKKKMLRRIVKHIFPSSGQEGFDSSLDDHRPYPQGDNVSLSTPFDSTPREETSRMEVCPVTDMGSSRDHHFSDLSGYTFVSQVSFHDFDAMVQRCEYTRTSYFRFYLLQCLV